MDEDDVLQEAPRGPQYSKTRPIVISVLTVLVIAFVVGSVILGVQLVSNRQTAQPNAPPPSPSVNTPHDLSEASLLKY